MNKRIVSIVIYFFDKSDGRSKWGFDFFPGISTCGILNVRHVDGVGSESIFARIELSQVRASMNCKCDTTAPVECMWNLQYAIGHASSARKMYENRDKQKLSELLL